MLSASSPHCYNSVGFSHPRLLFEEVVDATSVSYSFLESGYETIKPLGFYARKLQVQVQDLLTVTHN